MELTIAIHREDKGYWAQVTKSEDEYIEGVSTDALTLREVPELLEWALQMVLDDDTATLVIPEVTVGMVRGTLTRSPDAAGLS